jgi:hypothetical protein
MNDPQVCGHAAALPHEQRSPSRLEAVARPLGERAQGARGRKAPRAQAAFGATRREA